jgi:hypothetical protein
MVITMKIKDIRYIETNETRTDKFYPSVIGGTVRYYSAIILGYGFVFEYTNNNEENPKEGTIKTSPVKEYAENETEIIVKTRNSIYVFEK